MDFNILIRIFFACFILTSCERTAIFEHRGKWIDIPAYVSRDIQQLKKHACKEQKTIVFKGKEEHKLLMPKSWDKVMEPLLLCDINKASWQGAFTSDTIIDMDGMSVIRFTTDVIKIPIKRVEVHFNKNHQVEEMVIQKHIKSFFFQADQTIHYYPTKGYHLISAQKAIGLGMVHLEVKSKFTCP